MQTNSSRALQASLNALQGQPINAWKNYDSQVDAVTVKDLADFAATYFQKSRRTQVVVRP
jgi:zinc protease